MAEVKLPGIRDLRSNASVEERIQALTDAYYMLTKYLEFLLLNLDSLNISEIDADITRIKNLEAVNIITQTLITQTLYAEKGYIAELTVDQLDTSQKVKNYLNGNTDDVNYIKIYEQHIEFRTAKVKYGEDEITPLEPIQAVDRFGKPLYWVPDSDHKAVQYEANDDPVLVYQYDELTKAKIYFKNNEATGYYDVEWELGAGHGIPGFPERGKLFIQKDTEGGTIKYVRADGKEEFIRLCEDGIIISHDTLTKSEGKRVARFTIGTTQNGWTAEEVDYLCDGVDDQEEIIQALNDLPETGGEVVILDGTYNITASINIRKNNVSLRGNGNATILKRMYNSTDTKSGPTARGLITLNKKSGCKIQDLQIDGNRSRYPAFYNCGIYLYSSNNNTITGNTCDTNSSGIYLHSSSDNTITGNICNNNNNGYFGIFLDSSSNNMITGNTCNNNYNYGIYLYLSSNNTITGNTCNNNVQFFGIYLYESDNNTVTGNTCNNNETGIHISSSSSNNTITGNTCTNNAYGIFLASYSKNNAVTGNTCNNNSYSGIWLSRSNNNTITGNTCIRGTGTPEDYTTNQYTIFLVGTGNNYNLISSNNCMGKAVVIEGGTGNSAWGNKFDDTNDLP